MTPIGKLQIAASSGPDGSLWVSISHLFGAASFTWGIPVGGVDSFLEDFSRTVKEAANQALSGGMGGLMIPSSGEIARGHTCDGTEDPERCLGCRVVQASKLS
jgi:hypothetical protein